MLDQVMSAVARHARGIPEGAVRAAFAAAADAAWAVRPGSVRQLERNLEHVLAWRDGHVDRRTLRRLSRQGMQSYFAYFAEAMTVAGRSEEQLRARIRGAGSGLGPITEQAHADRQSDSAAIAMGHQGNWDYAGFWAKFDVAPVVTVAERLANEEMLKTFVGIRESLGMRILLTGTPHLTATLERELGQPNVLIPLLADRDLGRNGEFVRAFGSIIRVARGPATLAYDTGKPLYVVNMWREPLHGERKRKAHASQGYVCNVSGPVDVSGLEGMDREEAIAAITQRWVDVWAEGIAAHPESWHMLQPLFIDDLDLSRMHNVPPYVLESLKASQGGTQQ